VGFETKFVTTNFKTGEESFFKEELHKFMTKKKAIQVHEQGKLEFYE